MIQTLYEKFRPWSDGGSICLISDPHFNDPDCQLMNPNWIDPEEYLAIINSRVFKNDTLICLGDCGDLSYFSRMKAGRKILIKGNHDDKGNSVYTPYFDEIYEGPLFIAEKILLSHEPIIGLPFCLNIHGHWHNGLFEYTDNIGGKHLNLASDVVNWQVINLKEIIKAGYISKIDTIHRLTIDKATEKKLRGR